MSSTFLPPILAIDYGRRRMGLAVSRAGLAEPLEILANDQALLPRLRAICRQENIAQIVVGVSEGPSATEANRFREQLAKELKLPVTGVDETLSTNQARRKLRQAGRRLRHVDHLAAAEFLQDWMDGQGR
ncbi:MAG: Holliday junction resolvase RuvX [Candidatus Pacebacteria bacterium CG10_big_fil_rev_8_21_14_0_10_56_10]|nr:MAG: Holliday junction resolvase RuvX [Candidatus Pacebacteria bacterium CG10_big_fil_rev_8_21_14_0_10_56_10]